MRKITFFFSLLLLISCSGDSGFEKAYNNISTEEMMRHVSVLASDEFMGRAPFTRGEELTIEYLKNELINLGFEPAFGDSYFQDVPMVEISSEVVNPVIINTGTNEHKLFAPDDVAVISPRITGNIEIKDSELVFAGFGITAPEYEWEDFNGLDVKGKTIVVLVNDPGLYTGNVDLFKGREMTYYGRWTYKYEQAAKMGATGILIIHETEGAGYPYNIPRNSSISPNLYLQTGNENFDRCMFTGWLSAGSAEAIFSDAGYDVNKLRAEACKPGFRGFDMKATISISINNSFANNISKNVAGVLKGKETPDEVIIYSGHWDHFGVGEKEKGDSIFNGAVDNGTTMAMVFEIGRAFTNCIDKPDRSVMLFFPTSEEQGLLGSLYYTDHPVFDMAKTVACINNDLVLPIGRMKDVMITGYGQSDLDDMLEEAAAKQDRYLLPDPNAHTGMYFRSDHFAFAKKGVPSLYARGNCDSRKHGKEWAAMQEKDYINNRYHRPADNYDPETWNFEGIREDAQLAFELGYRLANSDTWPRWKEGSEFKNKRTIK
ncbi:MAG: M28 family peptidase [Bacteroidales bacterium]|nr:M28 family peptidase [Bacteroidales bacterium]